MEETLITKKGYENLCEEIKRLKNIERPLVAAEIKFARENGDLSENNEYISALQNQDILEKKIYELERKISMANVVNFFNTKMDTVSFGSTVKIRNEDDNKSYTYTIVGIDESDISKGLISNLSPIGKQLIGKKINEKVEFVTPSGKDFCFYVENIIFK